MQQESVIRQYLAIPPICRLRVFLHGPLEVWKRVDADVWQPVSRDAWGQGRPARSVFKCLLVAPRRRLSRSSIQDDLWPETDDFELADRTIYNAINQIRRVTGKMLVKTFEAAYEIADQSLIWVDYDACKVLLREAENQGCTSREALPLLEQALAYLERGELLEGESGTWAYGPRKKSEDMLKQCRLWLAQVYEDQGKLWQAGEQYRALCTSIPPDEEALQRWMNMLYQQGKHREAFEWYQAIKELVETQGFPLSFEVEQSILSLSKQPYKVLPALSQTLQHMSQTTTELSTQNWLVLSDSDVLDRLTALFTKPSIVGVSEVRYFDQQTRLYWQARESNTLSSNALYTSLLKYIDTMTMALARSHSLASRQQLCETISQTVLLTGILLYDMGQYTKAQKQYQIAFQASVEAENPVVQAVIWGWTSFTWTYSQDYQKALYCVQYARHLATPAISTPIQTWLAAIEAEIQAHLLNRDACIKCLDVLDRSLAVNSSLEVTHLFEFDPALLLGYKGVCLQQFYDAQKPETRGFLQEAKEALEHALVSEAPPRRKLYYFCDLASAYARQREVEKACDYVTQSLPTLLQFGVGSKTIHKHLLQVRLFLQPYKDTVAVRTFDDQLNFLHLRN